MIFGVRVVEVEFCGWGGCCATTVAPIMDGATGWDTGALAGWDTGVFAGWEVGVLVDVVLGDVVVTGAVVVFGAGDTIAGLDDVDGFVEVDGFDEVVGAGLDDVDGFDDVDGAGFEDVEDAGLDDVDVVGAIIGVKLVALRSAPKREAGEEEFVVLGSHITPPFPSSYGSQPCPLFPPPS
jgi:hypothetical protein